VEVINKMKKCTTFVSFTRPLIATLAFTTCVVFINFTFQTFPFCYLICYNFTHYSVQIVSINLVCVSVFLPFI